MPFDISPLLMHPESFDHEQNIPASHKNVLEYLECTQNAVRILRCNSIIKEYTMNFYYDEIWLTSALVWREFNGCRFWRET